MLSTFPPKLCGLATFAASLDTALRNLGDTVTVVAIRDSAELDAAPARARVQLINGNPSSIRHAAAVLSFSDVAIIQHEYGIFGGPDGDEVLEILRLLEVPAIVVLHTVPAHPTPRQKWVLESVCDRAARVVVMTRAAGSRLNSLYSVDLTRVVTIPHGATLPGVTRPGRSSGVPHPPQLLTWGLIGPGKGIEHVIDALGANADMSPPVRYTIAGATHPKVLAAEGDRYRDSLIRAAIAAGVSDTVHFDGTYRNVSALMRFVASSAVVVLPYDSTDQVTSGVLVDAIAAGRPVIATAFPHAVELLANGAGIVVPHGDPMAMATAIREVFTDGELRHSMSARAKQLAPSLSWGNVARRYALLCDELTASVSATT